MKLFIKILFFSIVILSCQDSNKWNEIEVGNTIKVSSSKENLSNNYKYKWSSPLNYPSNTSDFKVNPKFEFKDNNFYFTPQYTGSYVVILEVTDLKDSLIYTENFLFNATASKLTLSDKEDTSLDDSKNDVPENSTSIDGNLDFIENTNLSETTNIEDVEKRYTIQIAVWKTREKAIEDKLYLKELGYDAYIEERLLEENDQVVYRVRVGSFSSKIQAEETRDELLTKEKKWGNELWIANTK